jgi:hypothetical protein
MTVEVNAIAIKPNDGFDGMELTPDSLGAILARYSRSNKGIKALYEKFKDSDPETVMSYADYGHGSILDLTGQIAVTIDKCSMYFAMTLFNLAKLGSGQECSTRYISYRREEMCLDDIPEYMRQEFTLVMNECMEMYSVLSITMQTIRLVSGFLCALKQEWRL